MATKVCSKCKVEKDVAEFYSAGRKGCKYGKGSKCKACTLADRAAKRAEDSGRRKALRELETDAKLSRGLKACRMCGTEKPFSEFGDDPRGSLGRKAYCNRCCSERARRRYWSDPHAARVARREWRSRHLEACREADRERYRLNPQKKLEAQRLRWATLMETQPEEVRRRKRECYWANHDNYLQKARERYHSNPESARVRVDRWRNANPERVLAAQRNWKRAGRSELSNWYIEERLKRAGIQDPSPELIEMKREQLMLYRLTKQLFETIKEVSGNESDRVDESPVGDGPEE